MYTYVFMYTSIYVCMYNVWESIFALHKFPEMSFSLTILFEQDTLSIK